MSLYFIILGGTFLLPFVLSFDGKVAFYRKWKYFFPAALLAATIFIPWDINFTCRGVWGFSPGFLNGTTLFALPVEEWVFFLVIPYASVFTYEVTGTYMHGLIQIRTARQISKVLLGAALIAVLVFRQEAYPFWTFSFMAVLLILHLQVLKMDSLGWFYTAYLLVLMPFMIVNGMLTGTAMPGEVVWYNNSETMGIRILTIPLEDFFYGFNLMLLNVTLYEALRSGVSIRSGSPFGVRP